jgi:protein gp37
MNLTKIEWCNYSWNPIVGCQIGCKYCWARPYFNFRFGDSGSRFDVPELKSYRLKEPYQRKKQTKIFVCDMGDIFSPGVKDEWIEQVIQVVRENRHHTFQFLTKRPERYRDFSWPENVWLGATVESASKAYRIKELLSCGCKFASFVVVEPLMSSMQSVDFSGVDFVYVGAMTGPGAKPPPKEWIYSIKHNNIIYKENIKHLL